MRALARRDKKNFIGREIYSGPNIFVNHIQRSENLSDGKCSRFRRRCRSSATISQWNLTLDVSCRPENFEGQFPDSLGYDSFATDGTGHGFLKEQAKIKHACINRECQSSLRRGGRTDLYLLTFDIRGLCAMQFLSMGFMRKYLGVIWKLLSLISTGSNAIVSPRNSNWPCDAPPSDTGDEIIHQCSEISLYLFSRYENAFYYYCFISYETLIVTISILLL